MELFTKDAKLRKGLANARHELKAFGGFVKKTGANMVLGGAAIAMPFIMALPIFAQFSDKMSEVQAITGAVGADFALLNDTAKKLGSTTSFSASQVADGMKFLGMAGFETQEIIAGIPAVLNLARAGAIELGVAADIASDVGSAFGMAANEIGHLADVIAVTATSANTSVEMMGESFKYVAPVAKAAGQSLEETAAAIGLLGNSGIKASMAGTDLKNILIAFVKQKSVLEKFGVSATDAQGRMRPLLDVMRELGQATSGMSEAEKLSFFMETFGKISGKSALILAGLNSEVDVMRGKLADADGAAARMAKVMDDNLGGSFRALLSAMEGMAISLIEQVADPLRDIVDGMSFAASIASKWMQENQGLVRTIALVSAGLVAGGSVLFLFGGAALLASAALGGVSAMLTGLGAVMGFLLSPVTLVTAAVLAGAGALVYFSGVGGKAVKWISSQFTGLGENATKVFTAIRQAMAAGDYKKAAEILWLALNVAWISGINQLNAKVADWKAYFLEIWYGTIDQATKYFTDSWADLQNTWTTVTQFFGDAWDAVMNRVQRVWSTVGGRIVDGIDSVMDYIKAIHPAMKSVLPESGEFRFRAKQVTGVGLSSSEIDEATTKSVAKRIEDTEGRRREIENQRLGANQAVDEDAQLRRAGLEQAQANAQKKSDNELKAAQVALAQAMRETSSQISDSADKVQNGETKTVQAAKTASAPGGAFDEAKQSTSSSGGNSGDLRTKEGMDTLARLINMNGGDSVQDDQLATLKRILTAVSNGQQIKVVRSG